MRRFTTSLVVSLTGCATSGYQKLPPGAPLAVEPIITQVPETVESTLRDDRGVTIATQSTVVGYRPRMTDFRLKQGDREIDEQDFYHLAGDSDAERTIADARSSAKLMNTIGWGVVGACGVAAVSAPIAMGKTGAYVTEGAIVIGALAATFAGLAHANINKKKLPAKRAYQAIGSKAAAR